MSDSDMSSSDTDKSSEMTNLKNKKAVVKSSSSESSDEDEKQVSKVKKKRLSKSQNYSDSDSSHIEPSQFRSPKLNNYQISKTLPEKTKSSKSIKKFGASKSHDISSSSEDESDVESVRRNNSAQKRKHEETSEESSESTESYKSLQNIQKKQDGKPRGQGKSPQKLSRSTVLSSASDDEEQETSRSKSTTKSKPSPRNKPTRDESDSTDLSDIHALAESNPEDLELWLIKVPAKVPLSSLPQQVLTDGIQDFSKHKKRYELISFTDEMIQRDHVSFFQGKSHHLLEGPCVKGQMQIVCKPSAPLQPVTAPLISHKPVPFPAGLKIRFTPFGADAPASVNNSPKSRKLKKKKFSENEDTSMNCVEDVDASPRKKKKKKKKHSID